MRCATEMLARSMNYKVEIRRHGRKGQEAYLLDEPLSLILLLDVTVDWLAIGIEVKGQLNLVQLECIRLEAIGGQLAG